MKYLAWVPGENFGGCEAYALRIAKKAYDLGWDVKVLCLHKKCFDVFKTKVEKIEVFFINDHFSNIKVNKKLFVYLKRLFLSNRFYLMLINDKPDIIHAILPWHYHSESFLIACDRANMPCLITFQLVGPNSQPPKNYIRLIRKLVKKKTRLCAISENNRSLLLEYFGTEKGSLYCIPNRPEKKISAELPIDSRIKLRNKLGCKPNEIMILSVGSLFFRKGYDLLIKAIPTLIQQHPSLRFFVAGEGEEKGKFEKHAKDLGVEKYLFFLGHRDDVQELLQSADFFLFPTRFEGESFALLEAAEYGLPIIASKASGIPETFKDGVDALLFDVDDVNGLISKMLDAIGDPYNTKQRILSAKKRVSQYNENDMLKDTFDLLLKIAKKC